MKYMKKFEANSADILFGKDAINSEKEIRKNAPREQITIPKERLRDIINEEEDNEYELVEDKIVSSDDEDGGADHVLIIKRIVDEKFFRLRYTDWDMRHNFRRDFPERLGEVFPRPITKFVYE